jgi:hypothetical protein
MRSWRLWREMPRRIAALNQRQKTQAKGGPRFGKRGDLVVLRSVLIGYQIPGLKNGAFRWLKLPSAHCLLLTGD